jgi:DNA-binding NtrC family response regulator
MGPGSRRASGELVRAYPSAGVDVACEIIAHSEASRALLGRLAQYARDLRPVLICGETGTGKTMLAQLLHARSGAAHPLRMVNCAALSDALLADQLRRQDPATLLVDEVGELSPWGQAVLLHRLQSDAGQTRVLAATHRDLDQMVQYGAFSRELLARLDGSRVRLSPLRVRRDDIVPLALHFLRVGLCNLDLKLISVEPELFKLVERYDWPGNVRELKNAMLHVLAVNESGTLDVADLPDAVRTPPAVAKGYSR